MRIMYCWRCKMDLPMLDDEEFAVMEELYARGYDTERLKKQHDKTLCELTLEDRFSPVLDAYERMTEMRETNPFAVMHHEISCYGPPCIHCGKPLRTSKAKWCAFRGAWRNPPDDADRLL